MKLVERSFSGKVFRPRPEVLCETDGSLCIVATPWGPRATARKVIQSVVDLFHSARSDDEVTSPFQVLTGLSSMANNLRAAVMLANDTIYREENRSEYLSGVELFVAARRNNELAWAHVGGPHVLLDRTGFDLQILAASPDSALAHSDQQQMLAPLPSALLGVGPTTNLSVHSVRLQTEDRLVLVHRSVIPPRLQTLKASERELVPMSQLLARQSADLPFWLGILSFA
ncbi:MAG: hypothetical protein AB7N80_01670 [Bdellovibrionales bacterium]